MSEWVVDVGPNTDGKWSWETESLESAFQNLEGAVHFGPPTNCTDCLPRLERIEADIVKIETGTHPAGAVPLRLRLDAILDRRSDATR